MLRRVCSAAVLLASGLATLAEAESKEPLALPQGWLAAAAAPSVAHADSLVTSTLADLGYTAESPSRLAAAMLGAESLEFIGGGRLVAGVARRPTGGLCPFLVIADSDYRQLVAALRGETTGDTAAANLGGFPIALAPYGRGVLVVPLGEEAWALNPPSNETIGAAGEDSLRIALSADGIDYLAKRAEGFVPANPRQHRRLLRAPWRWPPSSAQLEAVLGVNAPFWRRLAEQAGGVAVTVARREGGGLRLRLTVDRVAAGRQPTAGLSEEPAEGGAVLDIRATALEAWLPDLLGLLTAYDQGRPDHVDAAAYSRRSYTEYEQRVREAARLVSSGSLRLLLPGPDEPAESNRVAVLETKEPARLVAAIGDVAEAWNRVLIDSEAESPVLFEQKPFEAGGPRGIELRADLVQAANVEDTPEMRALLDRYVGNDGWYVVRIGETPDGRVLVTDAGWRAATRSVATMPEIGVGPTPGLVSTPGHVATALWDLRRATQWRAAMHAIDFGSAIGYKPLGTMRAAPPVVVGVSVDSGRVAVGLAAPAETVRALGGYLRSK